MREMHGMSRMLFPVFAFVLVSLQWVLALTSRSAVRQHTQVQKVIVAASIGKEELSSGLIETAATAALTGLQGSVN